MVLASHQPDFAPYPGFFYKMLHSDVFVLSDDVQYSKSEMHKYNFVKSPDGKHRITIPVSFRTSDRISEVQLADNPHAINDVMKTIEMCYGKSPYYTEIHKPLFDILTSYTSLLMLNVALIQFVRNALGIKTKIVMGSNLSVGGQKDERLIRLCEALGADEYLSGTGAYDYHVPEVFDNAGIALKRSDYAPIHYPQRFGPFLENLSILDYLFNCGPVLPEEWR